MAGCILRATRKRRRACGIEPTCPHGPGPCRTASRPGPLETRSSVGAAAENSSNIRRYAIAGNRTTAKAGHQTDASEPVARWCGDEGTSGTTAQPRPAVGRRIPGPAPLGHRPGHHRTIARSEVSLPVGRRRLRPRRGPSASTSGSVTTRVPVGRPARRIGLTCRARPQ